MLKNFKYLINQILTDKKKFFLFAVILYVVIRLATLFFPYDNDEWIFHYVGQKYAEGNIMYLVAWDHKPPLIFFFNGLMSLITSNFIILRVFYTLINLGSLFLFSKVVNIFTATLQTKNSLKLNRIALLLFIFWTNLAQISSGGNNTENFGLFFILLMVLTYFLFLQKHKTVYLLATGLALSCMVLLKPNFVLFSLPVFLDLLIRFKKDCKKLLLAYFLIALPVVIHVALWLAYFYQNNALNEFWLASFLYNSKYLQSGWQGHVSSQLSFILSSSLLFIPAAPFVISFLKTKAFFSNEYRRYLFLWLLAVLLFVSILGTFYPFYYLVTLPLLIIICVLNLEAITGNTFFKKVLRIVIVLCMLTALAISYKFLLNNFYGSTKERAKEDQQIASYIRNNTTPADKIYAYTYGATFYVLTGRDAGSKYVSASYLLLNYREHYGFNFNEQFQQEILASKPKYIIYPKSESNLYLQNTELVEFFKENYPVVAKEFTTFVILSKQ